MVETTMTIDVKIQFSQDALLEKRIFLLDRKAFPEGLTLAAAEWEAERLVSMDSLGAVLELVREKSQKPWAPMIFGCCLDILLGRTTAESSAIESCLVLSNIKEWILERVRRLLSPWWSRVGE